jgi:hypothetical protein
MPLCIPTPHFERESQAVMYNASEPSASSGTVFNVHFVIRTHSDILVRCNLTPSSTATHSQRRDTSASLRKRNSPSSNLGTLASVSRRSENLSTNIVEANYTLRGTYMFMKSAMAQVGSSGSIYTSIQEVFFFVLHFYVVTIYLS